MGTWNSRGLRGSTLEDLINHTNEVYREKKLALICNFSGQPSSVTLETEYENVVFVNYEQTTMQGKDLLLKPYEVVVLEA